ncbi:tRNA preQ1(34) S-adenosylmethionine ribosyltransferase-isomerase QueA [Paenibacillus albiflavus]|uniref:S-adenosylmethionine:tRNA ribosyltransferase-isomerase n=1 Tax=Paenibacillus albiflavus TaxID=2545760 RepID=A0A4R4E6J0_9BACL|nr:tRNA preQ1(34) S-adenosylmethionine ribosyltransferase-isomerase QueA [Paenibacillus albiflavus]TCZ75119.1 tRNA preQ1(34) S-adenosylmethionine ribosyltransferase-isomerase QueA [Paenibacillus albiflavus]
MDLNEFDFDLPEELIAQTPLVNRTGSRLLTLNKQTGEIKHQQFEQLIDYLQVGDLLVMNDTRVIPARLFGFKQDTGAKAELLLLKSLGNDEWQTLVKPGKRVKKGTVLEFGNLDSEGKIITPLLRATVLEEGEMGERRIKFQYEGIFNEILDQLGQMPLPPYIKERLQDKERYQTVYAKHEGSAAAPTAGLHFTTEMLERIQAKGVQLAYVTLHVGLGTFRPVSVDHIEEHKMHEEYYELSQETADAINQVRARGGRIIAVGTTSARTLETVAQRPFPLESCNGWTDIFIYPGYQYKLVDALLTNFHLPKSTLLMLISALAGKENVMHAYEEAVKEQYRFFSFGDAMFIYE